MRAFAQALDVIPLSLAENSGLSAIETLAYVKSEQLKGRNRGKLGIDCLSLDENDMSKLFVIDSLVSKRQQLLLATQVCRMILKVNDVIVTEKDQPGAY